MKKALEVLLNKVFKKDLELLYGDGTYIIINRVYLSEYQKCYIVDCKLMVPKDSEYDDFEMAYPEGLNYIMAESWKYLVISEKTQFLSTVDFF
jgi:hypothetical protein